MKISEIVAKGSTYSSVEVQLLRAEVELSLKKNKLGQDEIMAARSKLLYPPPSPGDFFRSGERNERAGLLLQHLLAFLAEIPEKTGCEKKRLPPLAPFRECIFSHVALLREKDVQQAVFNEVNLMDAPDGDNVWDYQRQIIEKNRAWIKALAGCPGAGPGAVFTLCQVLENLCLFWFDVRGNNMNRIRQSDIHVYKLARILQGRCRQTTEPGP
jgi:hypothetical protein